MKVGIQMNLGHQLTLTPQLKQAIQFLQLSTLDLREEIQSKLDSNPLLEAQYSESDLNSFTDEDTFIPATKSKRTASQNPFETLILPESLKDHFNWQLNLSSLSEGDKLIAITLIDAIDDNGFLTLSLKELMDSLQNRYGEAEIRSVQHLLQRFDPVGCFTHSFQETLSVQLDMKPEKTPYLAVAKLIVKDDFESLDTKYRHSLIKRYHLDTPTLEAVLNLLKTLNPKPGSSFSQQSLNTCPPDLIVKKGISTWEVTLNQAILPSLSINALYATCLSVAKNAKEVAFIKHHLQEAKWFLKSIQSRQVTLLRVGQAIVEMQQGFLERGPIAMVPLTLEVLAQKLHLHESTISRITTQKFMHTPYGLVELKSFFSTALPKDEGMCSSTSIKAKIKKLISEEDSHHPLSDQALMKLIQKEGIKVARRTVTKYRENMNIPSSHQRKV